MIDIRKLKELVRLMVENELSELDIKDQQETVTLKRGGGGTVINHQPVIYSGAAGLAPAPAPRVAPAPAHADEASDGEGEGASAAASGSAPAAAPAASAAPAAAAKPASDAGLVAINSPMVGTFYPAPNPDSPPFVTVGAAVTPETTVCLVEAMKVFNEIKAETTGVVERVLVQSGAAVEYGQKLFLVRPA